MKILSRYVLREFCVPLFYCLTGFVSIYLLFELFGSFSRLMEAKPGLWTALTYLAGYLAPYFEWMAPACLMLATLYTMWNFCRHSELIAMRASGIGFFTIVKPLLFAATLMAVFVGWVNEYYVPRYGQWAKMFKDARFKADAMEVAANPNYDYVNVLKNRNWYIEVVMTDDASVLEGVIIEERSPQQKPLRTIKCARMEYLDGIWYLLYPEITCYNEDGSVAPPGNDELDKTLTLRPFPYLDETPEDILLQHRKFEYCNTRQRFRKIKSEPTIEPEQQRKYTYDLWAQIMSPLACIIITLFSIPAGIATGRQSVFWGIVSALLMFFAFYGLTMLCMAFAYMGWLPPLLAAILPDIVFLGIGCRLFWKQR